MATGKLLAHALAYAAGGFPVLPLHSPDAGACTCRRRDCDSPAKHPRTANGLTDASTDEATIRRWWARWPAANVGIAVPDTHVVIDVDVVEATGALDGRDLPTTATARTGRGWQFLYRTTRAVRPAVGVLPHVDIRGVGSYVVAPPSQHISGAEYVWVAPPKDGIAAAPAWVYEVGTKARPVAEPGASIRVGERNAQLTSMAGAMRHHGATAEEIRAALVAMNARCDPPLDDSEVQRIALSIARYPLGERGPRLVIGGESPSTLRAVRLMDVEVRQSRPLRYGRWDPDEHSVLFGDGGTGKGILAANDVARLSREDEIVLILDYERHVESEWRPRIEAFGGDLERVFVAHPDRAIWDVADDVVRLIGTTEATWIVVDSVAYACLGMEVEKSVTATRYSAAIARLARPVLSLAHTTKADTDPKHPFGSVFWSNGARITAGMSAPDEAKRLLKNRKTNQRAPFAPVEFDWSWSDEGVLPAQLAERRASITLAERAWEALSDWALSSEALLRAVNGDGGQPVTLKTLKPVLSRSPRIESTATGWRRAGARLEIVRKRDNGEVSSEASGTDNGQDNDAATHEREHDNETDNTRATDRRVVVVPSVEGQQTTVRTSFAEGFAKQQAEAWASLDSGV